MSIFRSPEKMETAARLIVAGKLNNVEIAAYIGITDRQLRRWKHKPEFQARVQQHREGLAREWEDQQEVGARTESKKMWATDGAPGRLTGGLTAMELARRRLTGVQLEAALMVALDQLSNQEIGRRCGVSGRCIEKWKRNPAFYAEVIEHWDRWREMFSPGRSGQKPMNVPPTFRRKL